MLILDSKQTLSQDQREVLGLVFEFPQTSQEAKDRHRPNLDRLDEWFGRATGGRDATATSSAGGNTPGTTLSGSASPGGQAQGGEGQNGAGETISISANAPARLKQQSQEEIRKLMLLEGSFRLLETATDITHRPQPMCAKCCQSVLIQMNQQRKRLEDESDQCRAAVEKLEYDTEQLLLKTAETTDQLGNELSDEEIQRLQEEEIARLEEEEAELLKELDEVWKERAEIALKVEQLQEEATELDEFEQKYWRAMRDYEAMCSELNEKQFRLIEQKTHAEQILVDLHRMSALADVFRISYIGHIGTISGFRLAHAGDTIEWHEANAALGQVLLLLDTVRKRHGLTLSHILYPLGAFSKIKRADGQTLELYRVESTLGLGFFKQHTFDQALVALLKVVNEIGQVAQKSWKNLPLYPIVVDDKEGTIGGISVRYAAHNVRMM